MTNIVEIAAMRIKSDVTEADLLTASNAFQRDFLVGRRGFVRRELCRLDARNFIDLVHWNSREAADAVMQEMMTSPVCLAYLALMEFDPAAADDSVKHYTSLATYGA